MPSADINSLAVVVAALLSMVIGAVWYSPQVFGAAWMKLIGKKEKDLRDGATTGYIIAALSFLLVAFVLAHAVDFTRATTFTQGLEVGFWVWLGLIAPIMAINYSFGNRPQKLWVIDSGYFLACLLVSGALLATWV